MKKSKKAKGLTFREDEEHCSKNEKGWECPVCHKGNAPFAIKCGHCVTRTPEERSFRPIEDGVYFI